MSPNQAMDAVQYDLYFTLMYVAAEQYRPRRHTSGWAHDSTAARPGPGSHYHGIDNLLQPTLPEAEIQRVRDRLDAELVQFWNWRQRLRTCRIAPLWSTSTCPGPSFG